VGTLEDILPETIRSSAMTMGKELVLHHPYALLAIDLADRHHIAVLGVELCEIQEDGVLVPDYSGYDSNIPEGGDWQTYALGMNLEAKRWVEKHPIVSNQGYILTSTSEKEFRDLKTLKRS
jgi:hypothetical protein